MSSTRPEIEGETAEWAQPVNTGFDWRSDFVSRTRDTHTVSSTYQRLKHRTLEGIKQKVVKQGKRNAVLRFILAKSDKEKITVWKQDLARVLHIFNVRLIRLDKYLPAQ